MGHQYYDPMDHKYAGMAELADALDLGSSVFDVGVQVLFPAPNKKLAKANFFIYQKYIDSFSQSV
jgi:hypothetical protein